MNERKMRAAEDTFDANLIAIYLHFHHHYFPLQKIEHVLVLLSLHDSSTIIVRILPRNLSFL